MDSKKYMAEITYIAVPLKMRGKKQNGFSKTYDDSKTANCQ